MTLDEIKKLPPLTEAEIRQIQTFNEKLDDPDCPPLTSEQLAQLKPLSEIHPEWYRVKKADVHLKLDVDVLEWFKSQGRGYQTKINAVLRAYAFENLNIH